MSVGLNQSVWHISLSQDVVRNFSQIIFVQLKLHLLFVQTDKFAVQCAKNGIPAPMVKEALGHHSLNVTDIYTSVIDDDAADMIRCDGPSD